MSQKQFDERTQWVYDERTFPVWNSAFDKSIRTDMIRDDRRAAGGAGRHRADPVAGDTGLRGQLALKMAAVAGSRRVRSAAAPFDPSRP
jgi:hypothetical protein